MYHSITFGNKNTWDDWHLIPSTRPLFNPPDVKTHILDIPGANGQIDLTESLTGYPLYENRKGSWEFNVANGYQDWDVLYSEILGYLHGQTMKAYLEDVPYFYFEGRFKVDEWNSDKWWSKITISYDVYPYMKEINSSVEPWLWDPFDFKYGIIRDYKDIRVDGSLDLVIEGRQEPIVPIINATLEPGTRMTVYIGSEENYRINDGENVIPNIVIGSENVTLRFVGNGTISVNYRGGKL